MTKGTPETFDNHSRYDRCKENERIVFFRKGMNRMKREQVFYCRRYPLKFMLEMNSRMFSKFLKLSRMLLQCMEEDSLDWKILNCVRELREVTVREGTPLKRVRTYEDQARREEKTVQIYL